jgi:hypothetical protein
MPTTTTRFKNVATKTPEQMDVLNQLLSILSPELLSQLMGSEEQFIDRFQRGVADPAMRQFREQIIPELQTAFAGSGSKGGTAQEAQLIGAGERLSKDLASLLAQAQSGELQQQRGFASNIAQLGLGTSPFENVAIQKTRTSPFETFLGSLGQGVGGLAARPVLGLAEKGVSAISKLFGV